MNALNQSNENNPDGDDQAAGVNTDQTTLLHNEEEGFALAPVDTTTVKGMKLLYYSIFQLLFIYVILLFFFRMGPP